MAQQLQRLPQREVPEELPALAEDDADAPGEAGPLPGRVDARHPDRAGAGLEDPGQHLHGRRLAGAVGTDVADYLARARHRTRWRRRRTSLRTRRHAPARTRTEKLSVSPSATIAVPRWRTPIPQTARATKGMTAATAGVNSGMKRGRPSGSGRPRISSAG